MNQTNMKTIFTGTKIGILLSLALIAGIPLLASAQTRSATIDATYQSALTTLQEKRALLLQTKTSEAQREYLLSTLDALEKRIDGLTAWIMQNQSIYNVDKEVVLAEFEGYKTNINRLYTTVEKASLDAIPALVVEVKTLIDSHSSLYKKYTVRLKLSRLSYSVQDLSAFTDRLESSIPAGEISDEHSKLFANTRAELSSAQTIVDSALVKLRTTPLSSVHETETLTKEAYTHIQKATQILTMIITSIE